MENPIKMDDLGLYTHILGNTHVYVLSYVAFPWSIWSTPMTWVFHGMFRRAPYPAPPNVPSPQK